MCVCVCVERVYTSITKQWYCTELTDVNLPQNFIANSKLSLGGTSSSGMKGGKEGGIEWRGRHGL